MVGLRILCTVGSGLRNIHALAGPSKPREVHALETKTCVSIDYLRNITEYSDFQGEMMEKYCLRLGLSIRGFYKRPVCVNLELLPALKESQWVSLQPVDGGNVGYDCANCDDRFAFHVYDGPGQHHFSSFCTKCRIQPWIPFRWGRRALGPSPLSLQVHVPSP